MAPVKQWVFEQPATAWDPALFSWWLLGSRQPQIQLSKNSPCSVSCVKYSWLLCVICNMQVYIILNLLYYNSGHWGRHLDLRVVTGDGIKLHNEQIVTYTSYRILFRWTDQERSDGGGARAGREEKRSVYGILIEKSERKYNLEDLGIDGRIILKCTLKS